MLIDQIHKLGPIREAHTPELPHVLLVLLLGRKRDRNHVPWLEPTNIKLDTTCNERPIERTWRFPRCKYNHLFFEPFNVAEPWTSFVIRPKVLPVRIKYDCPDRHLAVTAFGDGRGV